MFARTLLALSIAAVSPRAAAAAPATVAEAPAAPAMAGQGGAAAPALPAPVVRLAVPVFAPEFAAMPAARVEGEVVTVGELADAIEEAHRTGTHEGAGRRDYGKLLDRLVNVALVVAEARAMGLDEQPEAKEALRAGQEKLLIKMLQEKLTGGVKADPAIVDRQFKQAVQEWKLRAVVFKGEADAKRLMALVTKGQPFLAAVAQAVKEKWAESSEPEAFVKPSALTPKVAAAVAVLQKGQATPPVQVERGWTIVRLEDVRYPENPAARRTAEEQALLAARQDAVRKAYQGLEKRYLVRDDALLKSVNFDKPKGGTAALEKDGRVVAKIIGGQDITLGALAKEMHGQLYHGVSEAQKAKQIDKTKFVALDAMVSRRIIPLEATRLGIPATAEYVKAAREYERSYLFSAFVGAVVAPGVSTKPEEIKAWYDAHQGDYMYPPFYRLDALGFAKQEDAMAAAVKLRQGTDFKWLRANADGVVPEREAALKADSANVVSARAIPEGLAKLLDGARAGDVRTYAAEGSQHFVLAVREVVPPRPQPIEEATPDIQQRVFGQALGAAMEDWFKKLRAARKVESYLER